MNDRLDNYLLELILMDTVAAAGGRCIPGAECVIQRYIPQDLYERIIERYDELSDDQEDDNAHFLAPWLSIAAGKDSCWKRKMILRFIAILRAGGPIGRAELKDMATLAAAIDATQECRQVFCLAHVLNRRRWLTFMRCRMP